MPGDTDGPQMIRVLVVDDEPDIRVLVRTMLGIDGRFEVAGEAPNGRAALEQFAVLRPDVVVLDQRMPELEGLVAAARILAAHPEQPVILMSAFLNDALVADATALGVRAVLGKQDLRRLGDEILRILT